MKIIGIDPGLQKTGWGIISKNGNALSYVACGLIKTDTKATLPERLRHIHDHLSVIIKEHAPESAAVEETFVNKNPASALKLGQARGVALVVPSLFNLPVAEYSANKIKKSVVSSGHAGKDQIFMMVRTLLPGAPKDMAKDSADALAIAVTHWHLSRQRAVGGRQ